MHVCTTVTGYTLSSNIKTMITGWEEVDEWGWMGALSIARERNTIRLSISRAIVMGG